MHFVEITVDVELDDGRPVISGAVTSCSTSKRFSRPTLLAPVESRPATQNSVISTISTSIE
jgi:hypothetical protein